MSGVWWGMLLYACLGELLELVASLPGCKQEEGSGRPLETRVHNAEVVFRGVAITATSGNEELEMALVSVYKGALALARVSPYGGTPFNTTDRRVIVIGGACWLHADGVARGLSSPLPQFVVFGMVHQSLTPSVYPTDTAVPWTSAVDTAIWSSVGWSGWSEWSGCSVSCGGGHETRTRLCDGGGCKGPQLMTRSCNTFKCEDAVSLVARSTARLFHADWSRWSRIASRPSAFSLTPDSYVWLASEQVFATLFPGRFTLFASLRLRPESGGVGQGTVFSLVSRRRRDSYLSLELSGMGGVRLVHAAPQSDPQPIVTLNLDVPLHDLRWHRIAISIDDDSSVTSFVDCHWQRSDVLRRGQLATPSDADLIIGYLFSGDLEQLTILPSSGLASEQCSDLEVPSNTNIDELNNNNLKKRRINKK